MEPDAVEIRVLGCLIEKQRTTPDAYPLSLNALRLACNQSTNRDPVVEYDEAQIRDALHRLGPRRWTRLTSGASSRTSKYRQLVDEALGLAPAEMAVLCVLMLRGAQTPGELKQRTARLHDFADLEAIDATLDRLAERELAVALARRPGQKEVRWIQLLGGDDAVRHGAEGATAVPTEPLSSPGALDGAGHEPADALSDVAEPSPAEDDDGAGAPAATTPRPLAAVPAPVSAPAAPSPPSDLTRTAALERETRALRTELQTVRAEVRELKAALDALRTELGA